MFSRVGARCLFIAMACVVLLAMDSPSPQYKGITQFFLGGDGTWDYITLDTTARRLYIARGTRMIVADADSGKLIAEIPDTPGVHGIALAPELNRGFISAGRANKILAVDLKTLKVTNSVAAGENPDAILYHATTQRVFAFNGRSKDATVIEAESLKVLATIPLSGKPEFAVSDDHGRIFVNIEDTATVAVISTVQNKVVDEWPLPACEEPTGLAIDRKKGRLFVACSGNKIMAVVAAGNGKVLASVPIGAGSDGVAFDPTENLAFSANGRDGTVTIVAETSPEKFEVTQTLATQVSGRTIALDEKTHQLFIPAAKVHLTAGTGPQLAVEPDSFRLVVAGRQ